MSCECLPNIWFRLNVDQLSVALDCMVSVKLFCYFVCNVLSVFSNVDGSRISSIKNKDSCKRLRSNSVSHYLGNKLCKMQRSDTPIKINLKNRFKWPLLTHSFLTHSCSYHVMTLWTDVFGVFYGCPKTTAFHTTHPIMPNYSPHTKNVKWPFIILTNLITTTTSPRIQVSTVWPTKPN